jgi:hypothetical protein
MLHNIKISFERGIMQTVRLGDRGPRVSALGMGTWAWGDTLFWAYGKSFGESEVAAAFQASRIFAQNPRLYGSVSGGG